MKDFKWVTHKDKKKNALSLSKKGDIVAKRQRNVHLEKCAMYEEYNFRNITFRHHAALMLLVFAGVYSLW